MSETDPQNVHDKKGGEDGYLEEKTLIKAQQQPLQPLLGSNKYET
jgi:hypothetical protein